MFKRKRKRPLVVAILGSGPAGLFAAQAVHDAGHVVKIYSKGQKSEMYGAQYLHHPIPNLDCGGRQTVSYILKGTVESYRRKVYGNMPVQVSPEVLDSQHSAWNIRRAYDHAWERFNEFIIPTNIDPHWLASNLHFKQDVVVWSIPLKDQCISGHPFAVQSVWAQGDAPGLGRWCSVNVEPWTVVTNGEPNPRWYRASNVFGHRTAEWPDGAKPPFTGVARVQKPTANYCDCWIKVGVPVLRVGRYGRWMKGELSHQAYDRTREFLEIL